MPAEPKATLERLLHHLGFTATVEESAWEDGILLNINSPDAEALTGRNGQVLSDLQYLTNRLLFEVDQDTPKVTVDVDGYRARAREGLVKRAMDAAEKVRRWGDIVELEPMSAFDRRIVHNALKDDPQIETQSAEIEGSNKKVILLRPRSV